MNLTLPKINILIKFIAAISIVVLAAGAIVFTFKNKIEVGAKKINEKQNMLLALQRRESNVSLLRADYEIVKQNLPELEKTFPDEADLGKLIDALEILSVQTGNSQDLNFAPIAQAESLESTKSINFSASLTGNSASFVTYFRELKKLSYLIEVSSLSVSNGTGVSNNNTQLNYTAKVFIKK